MRELMMKDVGCFDGVFSIRIPRDWVEEKEDDGGIMFYAESPDSGTLRVNLLMIESPEDMVSDAPKQLLGLRAAKYGSEMISLEDGKAMVSYKLSTEEDGQPLEIWFWELINPMPPRHARIATFSFTVTTSRSKDQDILDQVAMLNQEIQNCRFSESGKLLPKLEQSIIAQGGKIVGLNSDGLLVATRSDGTALTLNIERMKTLIDSDEETLDSAITRFLTAHDRIWETMKDSKWQRSGLRMSLEKIEILQSGGLVYKPVSDQIVAVLEWLDPEETSLVMMTDELLSDWSITNDEAWKIASANMDEMLKASRVEILDLEDENLILACLSNPTSLKASLILAPGLRQHISELVGWPVIALIPCRDFLYLFPANEHMQDLASRAAESVMDEHNNSAYPLSCEVFLISDDGVKAIAEFSEAPK